MGGRIYVLGYAAEKKEIRRLTGCSQIVWGIVTLQQAKKVPERAKIWISWNYDDSLSQNAKLVLAHLRRKKCVVMNL